MQIKEKLRINVAVSAVMALVICLVFGLSLYRINTVNNLAKIAGEITVDTLERSAFRNDYLLNSNERAKEQWYAKHEKISKILNIASTDFQNPVDKKNIDEMIKYHELIGNIFSSVVANREKSGLNPASAALSHEVEDRLISQMNMTIYDIVINNRQLLETSRKARASVMKQAGVSIACLLAITVALAVINSWTMGRTIAERIRRLRDGAAVIGSGNLDHRIEVEGDDELSELSEGFNAMTEKLSGSYLDLEKEIKVRTRAEEELRKTRDELEIRIQERTRELKEANESLERRVSERTAELQAVNTNLLNSRRAALNMMEDAVAARRQTEEANAELQREITERKQAERALRESEEIYRAIGESIDYGIWICTADGSNIYASDSFLKMVGLTQEQCSSFGWGDVLHPDDAERTIAEWKECVRTGGTWDIEHRFKGIDGEWHPVLARGVPVRDDKGTIKYWVGINLDIKQMKLAEQTLRENEERLRFHAENSPMATIEWDTNFIVTRWTGEAEKIFGWSEAETVGRPIMDLLMIYEEDLPLVEKTIQNLTDGKTRRVISSNRNYTKDRKVIYCEWYNSVLLDSQGTMRSVMSQVLDVTARKSAEADRERLMAQLQVQTNELDSILKTLPYPVQVFGQDGRYVRINPAVIDIFGFDPTFVSREEIAARLHARLSDGTPVTPDTMPSSRALKGETTLNFEYLITNSSGEDRFLLLNAVPFIIDGQLRGAIVAQIDITKRKRTEHALQHSLTRFELLAYSARELLLSRDPLKIVETICDRVLEHLDCHAYFNFLVDEQAGRLRLNAYAGIPAEEAEKIEWLDYGVAVSGCAARDGHRIVAEHIPGTPDERTVLVKSYGIKAYACHPLVGADGKVIGTLSFGTRSHETFSDDDLSLMKAVADQVSIAMIRMNDEKLMKHANAELEVINKELEAFIYSVSHDLRSPLRSITGFAKFITDDYYDKLDDTCRDYIRRITRGTQRMNRLIDDLLDLSRISRQTMQHITVDISEIASEVVAGFREENPARRVETVIAEGLKVSGDGRLIRLVLSNLLGNAWKFTSRTENGRIEFGALNQESRTIYYVRDNGVGFDPDYKDKMFLPFQRLHSDDEFDGTGIGLTIVERIIHRHGGVVWAEGGTGKGAAIFFTLG